MGGARKQRGVIVRRYKTTSAIQIEFTYRGSRCRESLKIEATPSNLKYAANLRGEILNSIERGTFRYADYFPDSPRAKLFGHAGRRRTVEEALTSYIAGIEEAAAAGNMSPGTLHGYRSAVEHHLVPTFGKTALRDLTTAELRDWMRGMVTTAKTVRNILTPLRAVLDDAVADGEIEFSPLSKIQTRRVLRGHKRSGYVVDPFDLDEIRAILAASEGQSRNLIQFAFWSGLRTSELIALEWRDIDFVHGAVRVQRAVVEGVEKGPKTEAGRRDVLLLPPARAALVAQKPYSFIAGGRVFQRPVALVPWTHPSEIQREAWAPALKRAGVRYRIPYQTRHTYASMLLMAGERPLWVAQQMGHVDVEMIYRVYATWIPDPKQEGGYKPVADWNIDTGATREAGK